MEEEKPISSNSLWNKKYPERTEEEKRLISCMKQPMLAILSFFSYFSVCMEYNDMVCFTNAAGQEAPTS